MFFKTDAERAAAEATRARQDAGAAGASVASSARNLGAAALAGIAEATAPQDDRKGRRHARRTREKALRAAAADREAAQKSVLSARDHGARASQHGRKDLEARTAETRKEIGKRTEAARKEAAKRRAELEKRAAESRKELAKRNKKAGKKAKKAARKQGAAAQEFASTQASRARSLADDLAAGGAGATLAAMLHNAQDRTVDVRDRAVAGVDHGIDSFVPRAQDGVAGLAPQVDHVRDLINDELLPKIQAMLGDLQTGKDKVLAKDEGAVAALTGAPKAPRKKGGKLIFLGLLALAGAGVAYYLSQQDRTVRDPWAADSGPATTPEIDVQPAAPAETVDVRSTVEAAQEKEKARTAAPAATPTTPAAATQSPASDVEHAAERGLAAEDAEAHGENPHLLQTEEIDELGRDTPATAEELAKESEQDRKA